MPNKTVPTKTRHYGNIKKVKKKRHTGLLVILCVLAAAILGGVAYVGNHTEFTPDGVRFTFREQTETAAEKGITPLPTPAVEEGAFAPKVKPAFDVAYNELPNRETVPNINGRFVDIKAKTGEELTAAAEELYAEGISHVVVDLKALDGTLSYESASPMTQIREGISAPDTKLADFIGECHARGIKVIGVIHCFADNTIPRTENSHALCTDTGALFIDGRYNTWLDPKNEEVQQYILDLVGEAAAMGVREVILDEFCYPYSGDGIAVKTGTDDRTEVIMELLGKVKETAGEMRVGVVIYEDTAGEGFSEKEGHDLSVIDSLCDHIWMHVNALSETITYHGSLANLTADNGTKLCVELNGQYLSDRNYIELYKQETIAANAEKQEN